MFGGLIGGALSVVGGIVGRNDKKRENKKAEENHERRFDELRDNATAAGFNPLTALENGGLSSGPIYSAPPLASIQMITGGMTSVMDEFTGKAAQQRQSDKLQDDLTRIQIDRLRANPGAVETIGGTMARLGNAQTATAPQVPSTRYTSPTFLTPGREVEVDPRINSGGIMTIENALTGGPVHVWGDEVATDVSEGIFQGIQALPQIGWNWAKKGAAALGDHLDAASQRPPSSWDDAEHRRMYPNDY